MKILFILLVFCILLNSFVLPIWFNKLWFLLATTGVLIYLSLFRILIRKEKEKWYNIKSTFLVLFFVCLSNLLLAILGYTTSFTKNATQKTVLYHQPQKDTIIKGRVVMLNCPEIPVANAKISLSQANIIIDTFYTNLDGEFEYIIPKEVDLNNYILLKIEHLDFKPYETKILLTTVTIRELEVYLCRAIKR